MKLFTIISLLISFNSFSQIESNQSIQVNDINNKFKNLTKRYMKIQNSYYSFGNKEWTLVPNLSLNISLEEEKNIKMIVAGVMSNKTAKQHCSLRFYLNGNPLLSDSNETHGDLIQMGIDGQHWNSLFAVQMKTLPAGNHLIEIKGRNNGNGSCFFDNLSYSRAKLRVDIFK